MGTFDNVRLFISDKIKTESYRPDLAFQRLDTQEWHLILSKIDKLVTKEKPSETRNLSMGDMQKLTKKWNSRLGLQSARGPYSMHSMWPDFVLAPPPTPWIYWSTPSLTTLSWRTCQFPTSPSRGKRSTCWTGTHCTQI